MLVPPEVGTAERKEHDMDILRVYYMVCEETGLIENESIQKSFQLLMGWAGSNKFLEEFSIFREHIEKLRERERDGDAKEEVGGM